jgi:hypothetical protein
MHKPGHSMSHFVIDPIPFAPQPEALLAAVRLRPGSPDAESFLSLLAQAVRVARPKALYTEAYVEAHAMDSVTVGGVTFRSRTLRLNLDQVGRVFPFVATCGTEFDEISIPQEDFLARFWLDAIKEAALHASYQALVAILESRYALHKVASMSPGSGDITVWAIEEQRLLFSLLGDVKAKIGVMLTDSFLMTPNKTISGLVFPTEKAIRTCQVCRREDCPSRQAPFDPSAWEAIQTEM